jgi:acetyltransferase
VLLHLEHIGDTRKFMSAARRLARVKPVLVLKPQQDGPQSEPDSVYEAAFRRAGLLRVRDLPELFGAGGTLSGGTYRIGNRLAIVSNSRSIARLASETLLRLGGRLAKFGDEGRAAMEKLPGSRATVDNPFCLGEDAEADSFGQAVEIALKEKNVDGVLVINSPSPLVGEQDVAEAIARHKARPNRCLMVAWTGAKATSELGRLFAAKRIPAYQDPGQAVRAFMRLVQYRRNQELLMETPASIAETFHPDSDRARAIVSNALQAGREWLNEYEAMQLLDAYTIATVRTEMARGPEEAAAIAQELGRHAALKIMSPAVDSKSDVAGVRLGLQGAKEVKDCANSMLETLKRSHPDAVVDGFVVQPMEHRHGAFEITMGAQSGTNFGPVIRFGQGGTEFLQIDDLAFGLPPLNMNLAREIMMQTRIYPRLRGSGIRAADVESIAMMLIKISQIVVDLPEVRELRINPIWARPSEAVALDAKVAIAVKSADGPTQLAIKPYPRELEETHQLANGKSFLLRPIRPEDEPALQRMMERNPAEHLRMRFFQTLKELPHTLAAELTQIDYDREMALVLSDPGRPGKADLWGGVRMIADPNRERAEFSILIDHTLAGMGVGVWLMNKIIAHARNGGVKELWGEVLRENKSMLKLNRKLGFEVTPLPEDRSIMHVSLQIC